MDYKIDIRDELINDQNFHCQDYLFDELERCPVIKVLVWQRECKALLDSGSSCTCVNEKLIAKLKSEGIQMEEVPVKQTQLVTAGGGKTKKINSQIIIPVEIMKVHVNIQALVVPNLIFDLILGCDWLYNNNCGLEFNVNAVIVRLNGKIIKIPRKNDSCVSSCGIRKLEEVGEEEINSNAINRFGKLENEVKQMKINEEMKQKFMEIIH